MVRGMHHPQNNPDPDQPRRPLPNAIIRKADPGDQTEFLGALAHELNGLLDGSMRSLALAMRQLAKAEEAAAGTDASSEPPAEAGALESAQERLATVQQSLDRMSDLVHAAMTSAATSIGSALVPGGKPVALAEAIRHAIEVVQPGDKPGLKIDLQIGEGARKASAGALYAVVLNGLRNAAESIASAGGEGTIRVRAALASGESENGDILIEIEDDGPGLPPGIEPSDLFLLGVGTRGSGIGLSLCAKVIGEMGGTISIAAGSGGSRRPGALLRVRCPAPAEPSDTIGGA